jgi:hypothetical protein
MESADLLVVCGAGGFADSCKEWNLTTLSTLDGHPPQDPVVMLGHGFSGWKISSVRVVTPSL